MAEQVKWAIFTRVRFWGNKSLFKIGLTGIQLGRQKHGMVKFEEDGYMIIGGIDSNGVIMDKVHTFPDPEAPGNWTKYGKILNKS